MKKLSIVGTEIHKDEHVVGYCNAGDRMKYWGKLGAFWGLDIGIVGRFGLLFDSRHRAVDRCGATCRLVHRGSGGAVVVGGLSAIGAGLYRLGIPKDSILKYETALKTDKFILIAHGSMDEISHAKDILHRIDSEALEQDQ